MARATVSIRPTPTYGGTNHPTVFKTSAACLSCFVCIRVKLPVKVQLLRQPFGIGHDINHWNGSAKLQLRNQLEQKGSCRLSFLNKFVFGGTAISIKVPVRS